MTNKDYVGDDITVHWEPAICQHSGQCFRGLPSVFDPSGRPWVNVAGAPADEIAAAVDRCPSRALTYTRTDGAPMGRNGDAATGLVAVAAPADGVIIAVSTTTVEYRRNGPLVVTGPIDVRYPEGAVEHAEQTFLCRCGGSGQKPYCDGTHKRIGFEADGVEPPRR